MNREGGWGVAAVHMALQVGVAKRGVGGRGKGKRRRVGGRVVECGRREYRRKGS
jgi:hypothetical protein